MNVPNLIVGPLVNKDGQLTDDWQLFFQNLISGLQKNIGKEGYVVPTVTSAELLLIQNNVDVNGQYTCELGTLIRLAGTPGKVYIAMDGGSGTPQFREIPII